MHVIDSHFEIGPTIGVVTIWCLDARAPHFLSVIVHVGHLHCLMLLSNIYKLNYFKVIDRPTALAGLVE